jgi:hypothetical protein
LKLGEWHSVLKLSTEWHFNELRKRSITALSTEFKLGPVEKVALGLEYNVSHWLKDGFFQLVTRKEVITIADAKKIRWQSAIILYSIRDAWNTTMVFTKDEDVLKRMIHDAFKDDLQAMYDVERLHLTAREKEETKRLKELELKKPEATPIRPISSEEPLHIEQAPIDASAAPKQASQAQPTVHKTQPAATAHTPSPANTNATAKQYRTVVHVDKLLSPATAPGPPSTTTTTATQSATDATAQATQPRKRAQKDATPPSESTVDSTRPFGGLMDASTNSKVPSLSAVGFGGVKPTGKNAGGLNTSTQSSSLNSSTFTFSGKLFTGIS